MNRSGFILALLLVNGTALAEWTDTRQIAAVRVSGSGAEKTVYFESSTPWGIAGCPTAKFVYVRGNVALQEILAVGLAAKMGGNLVNFTGECQPDGQYFLADYISLQ